MTKNAITNIENFAALTLTDGPTIVDVLLANAGPGGITPADLDRVRVPAGGATVWSIPSLDGDQPAKTISGILLSQRDTRAYYSAAYDGSKNPPDCYSQDAIRGVGNPGGACATCPHAAWGSKGGESQGQACQLRKLLLVLLPESQLPLVISVPPSSIRPMRQYMLRLASAAARYWEVVTELSLEKVKSGSGIDYSQIVPRMVRRLTKEEMEKLSGYREPLLQAFGQVKVGQDD